MKPKSISRLFGRQSFQSLALVTAITAFAGSAHAASLTWDGSNTANAQPDGGTGTWDVATTANWWDGASNVTWPATGTANSAVFANTAGVVTLNSAALANSLTFSTTGYTVSGTGILTLNGASPSISVASGVSATLGNNTALVLAGSAGLTKVGAGTLTLSGSAVNSFTGGFNVNGGTVALNPGNLATPTNLIDGGNALGLQGGTLAVTGKSTGTSAQTFAGTNVATGTSAISLNRNGGTSSTLTLGAISHSVGGVVNFTTNTAMAGAVSTTEMIKVSNGTSPSNVGLAAWAVANGPTTVSGRWVSVDSSGALKLVTALNSPNIASINTDWSGINNASAVYTASVSVTVAGSPTAQAIQNNNTNNNTVTTALGANTLTVNGLSCIQPGVSNFWSFTSSGVGGIKVGAEKELVLIGAGNFNFSAPIADSIGGASGFTHAGGGSVSITGASTYTGQTTINSGVLQIGTGGSINSSSGVKVNAGTFLQSNTTTPVSPVVTLQGGIVGGTGTINTVNVASGTVGTASASVLTIGDLTFTGPGTFNLNGTASSTIAVTNALSTTLPSGKVAISLSTPPDWGTNTTYNLISYGSWSGSLSDLTLGSLPALGGRKTATLGSTGPTNGVITLTVAGDSIVWTGAASGNWTTNTIASPFNWLTLAGGADTQFLASDDVRFDDTATGTTAVVIPDANVATTTVTFANESHDYTVSGAFGISAGSFAKSGAGSVTLNTSNTYTGGTVIQDGPLVLGHPTDTLANTGAVTVSTGGTLDIGANSDSIGALNVSGGTVSGTTGVLTATAFNFQSGTVDANLAGTNAPVVKTTNGTVTVNGALNTTAPSGNNVIRVSGGSSGSYSTLILSPTEPSVIGTSNNFLTVAKDFGDYGVFTQTAGTLNTGSIGIGELGKGILNLSGGVTNTNSVTLAFTGPFSDNGRVDMNVDGTAALNINNNGKLILGTFYGRTVTITQTGGAVSLFSDTGSTLGGTGSLAFEGGSSASAYHLNGGTLAIPAITLRADGGGAGGGSGRVNFGGGTLKITSAGFTIPTVATKTIALNVLGDGSTANSGANIDTNGLTITLNAPLVHSGSNEIDGGLTKLGGGTLTLSSANTYTGPTTVNTGTLKLDSSGSIATASSVSIAPGAFLDTTAQASFTLAGAQPVTFGLDGSGAGSSGRIVAAGLNISAAAVSFNIVGTLDDPAYVLASYTSGSLSGSSFASVTPPSGYHLDYAYSGGTQIALVRNTSAGYSSWISDYPAVGSQNQPGDDPDADSMNNLLEYTLNGNPTVSDLSKLPALNASGSDFVFSFIRREESAGDTTQTFQYGSDLSGWTTVNITPPTDVGKVVIGTSVGGLQPVTVTIPKSFAVGGKLFGRLRVIQP